ncbi:MAG: hypothetical protein N6V49_05725, partial [Serratia symbiotica]|nr:hypothetical protein [Serratia symbiotica]
PPGFHTSFVSRFGIIPVDCIAHSNQHLAVSSRRTMNRLIIKFSNIAHVHSISSRRAENRFSATHPWNSQSGKQFLNACLALGKPG